MRWKRVAQAGAAWAVVVGVSVAVQATAWAAPPPNDAFASPVTLPGVSGAVAGTTVEATAEAEPSPDPTPCFCGDINSVWYRFEAVASGTVVLDTLGSTGTFDIGAYTADTIGNLPFEVVGVANTRLTFVARAGTVYRVQVDKNGTTTGPFTLHFSFAPPDNDDFGEATILTGLSGSRASSIAHATRQSIDPPATLPTTASNTVWFKFVAPSRGPVTLSIPTGVFDSQISVHTIDDFEDTFPTQAATASNDNANSSLLSLLTFNAARDQAYAVAVSNRSAAVSAFTLEYSFAPPVNDKFSSPTALSGANGTILRSNAHTTGEPNERAHAGRDTHSTLWYTLVPAASATLTVFTSSEVDTALAVYTGSSIFGLTERGASAPNGSTGAKVTFAATANTTYRIVVAGHRTSDQGLITLGWSLGPPANDDFANRIALPAPSGETAAVTMTGATAEPGEPAHAELPPVHTIWYTFTAPVDGIGVFSTRGSTATNHLMLYTGSQLANLNTVDGDYGVAEADGDTMALVGLDVGATYHLAIDGTTAGAVRLVYSFDSPPNDAFVLGQALFGTNGRVNGTNRDSTGDPGEPNHAGSAPDESVWYVFTAPVSGPVVLRVAPTSPSFDVVLAVYTGTSADSLSLVGSNNGSGLGDSRVSFAAVAGTQYRIAVDGFSGTTGTFGLDYALKPPANDNFANAVTLTGTSGDIPQAFVVGATGEAGEPVAFGGAINSVWFQFTAPVTAVVAIGIDGYFDLDPVVAAYEGSAVNALTLKGANDNANGGPDADLRFAAIAGHTYRIAVDGAGDTIGEFRLQYSFDPPANDDFVNREVISGASGSVPGSALGATQEANEPDIAQDSGDTSVWYDWTAPSTGTARFQLDAADTYSLDVFTGSALQSLTSLDFDQGSGGLGHSIITFPVTAGTHYFVAADQNTAPFTLSWQYVPPTVSIGDASVVEGTGGTVLLSLPVTLSGPTGSLVEVPFSTANASAIEPDDYEAVSGDVVFEPGETTGAVLVAITTDTIDEPDETLTVTLGSPTNAVLGDASAVGTIVDDDDPPDLKIVANAAKDEGTATTVKVKLRVTLTNPCSCTITSDFTTIDGTAVAPGDYTAATGTLTFAPGITEKTITVTLTRDAIAEPDETFTVRLTAATNAGFARRNATVTIRDDD